MVYCHGIKDGKVCPNTNLINAHIIPKAFARHIKKDDSVVIVTQNGVRKPGNQLGMFDSHILCHDCDQILGDYDKYAIETCVKFPAAAVSQSDSIWTMSDVDGSKFSKFVLAVLWRASISKLKEYEGIKLGPYENKARAVLFGLATLDSIPQFEVLLSRYENGVVSSDGFYTGVSLSSFHGCRCYALGLGGFQICAKLDGKLFPKEWKPHIINGNYELRGVYKDMRRTTEQQLLIKGAFKQKRRNILVKRAKAKG